MNITDDVILILCSRPESRRLPRKVFAKAAGVSILGHIANRVSAVGAHCVLAIPDDYGVGVLSEYKDCWDRIGYIFSGSSDSPLHRMAAVLKGSNKKYQWVIRITHDDPIIDATEVRNLVGS